MKARWAVHVLAVAATLLGIACATRSGESAHESARLQHLAGLPLMDLAEEVSNDVEAVKKAKGKQECFYTMADVRECNLLFPLKDHTYSHVQMMATIKHFKASLLGLWCSSDQRWVDKAGISFSSTHSQHKKFCKCVLLKKKCGVNAASMKKGKVNLKTKVKMLEEQLKELTEDIVPGLEDKLANSTGSSFDNNVKQAVRKQFLMRDNSFTAALQRVMKKVKDVKGGASNSTQVTDADITAAGGDPKEKFKDLSKAGSWMKIWKTLTGGPPRGTDGDCPENTKTYAMAIAGLDKRTKALMEKARKAMGCGLEAGFLKLLAPLKPPQRRIVIREMHDVDKKTARKVIAIMLDKMDSKKEKIDMDAAQGKMKEAIGIMSSQLEHSQRSVEYLKMGQKNMRDTLLNMEKMLQGLLRKSTGEDKLAKKALDSGKMVKAAEGIKDKALNIVKRFFREVQKVKKHAKKVATQFKKVRKIMETDLKKLGSVSKEEGGLENKMAKDTEKEESLGKPPGSGGDELLQMTAVESDAKPKTSSSGDSTEGGNKDDNRGKVPKKKGNEGDSKKKDAEGKTGTCKDGGSCDDDFGDLLGAGKKGMFRKWDYRAQTKELYVQFIRLVKKTKEVCVLIHKTRRALMGDKATLAGQVAEAKVKRRLARQEKIDDIKATQEMSKIGRKAKKKKCHCKHSTDRKADSQTEEKIDMQETSDDGEDFMGADSADDTTPAAVDEPMEDAPIDDLDMNGMDAINGDPPVPKKRLVPTNSAVRTATHSRCFCAGDDGWDGVMELLL